MRRLRLPALLLALLWGVAAGQTSWGVRVDVDLPLDQSVVEFATNPIGYARAHRDVIDARAFLESRRFGLEGRYRSSTEVFVGGYYVLSGQALFGQAMESRLGLYAGRDFRAGEFFVSLRGSFLLYGQIP